MICTRNVRFFIELHIAYFSWRSLFSSDLLDDMEAEATTQLATELPNTTENPDEVPMGRMVPQDTEEEVDTVAHLVLKKLQKFTKLFSGYLPGGPEAGLKDKDAHDTCDPEARNF